MDPITISVLGNLATDLVKWLAKEPCLPIDHAITETGEAFPQYEDLSKTLRQWLESTDVIKILYLHLKGLSDQKDLGLEPLTEAFLRDTQFFLPDGGKDAARKIIIHFLAQVRYEYLSIPSLGIPHVANRVEEALRVIRIHFESLDVPIPVVPPQPPLQIDQPKALTRDRLTMLLRPYNEFIGLIGRSQELNALHAFCEGAAAFRWKVITGDGGAGKTRLALELAKRREESGWRAGFLYGASLTSFVSHEEFPRWKPLADTLIIVDYAASKGDGLKRLLEHCGRWAQDREGTVRLRLLLVEREAAPESGWLHMLLASPEGSLRDEVRDNLEPLLETKAPGGDDPSAAMLDILRATFDAWSRLPGEGNAPPFPALDLAALRALRHQTDGRPLFVQMAALRACSEGDTSRLTEWGREDLLDYAVGRERQSINRYFGAGTTRTVLTERGVAFLTFTGPMPRNRAPWLNILATDARDLGFPYSQPGELSEDVATVLGESRAGPTPMIVPLGPDLLAEAFSVTVLCGDTRPSISVIQAMLECAGPLQVWFCWLRAAIDLYGLPKLGIIESWIISLLPSRPALELVLVERLLPPSSVGLGRICAAICEHLLAALMAGEEADPERSRILDRLAQWYVALGRREEALEAAERAVEIRERLIKQNPEASLPDFASSLSGLAMCCGEMGKQDEAMRVAERALAIREQLAGQKPDEYLPDLASSFTNLSHIYKTLGMREKALEAAERSMEIHERLAQQDSVLFAPSLALSLHNLGVAYIGVGKRNDAARAIGRANEILQQLAQQYPDAFEPDLAMNLNALSAVYSGFARHAEAVQAAERSVELRERLAKSNPKAFAEDLAMSLINLGKCYDEVGRLDEATRATERACEAYETLADQNQASFAPNLAMSLNNLAAWCYKLGKLEKASQAGERAVEIRERLALQSPTAFELDLAVSLTNLGNIYNALGRHDDALATGKRAVLILERLAKEKFEAFGAELAGSLIGLGNSYNLQGRKEEALGAVNGASEIYQRLAGQNPKAFEPNLAIALNNMRAIYGSLGKQKEALDAAIRTSEIYERLARQDPAAFELYSAISLRELGRLYRSTNPAEAIECFRRSVETLRGSLIRDPTGFGMQMVLFLKDYVDACESVGQDTDSTLLDPIFEVLMNMPSEYWRVPD